MILNALEGKSLPIYGDGRNIRDWLFVTDHCKAIWTVMKTGKRGETYNIGGNSELENIKVVEMICDILDEYEKIEGQRSRRSLMTFVKDRPGHDRRYAIDFTKIKTALNWFPEESFESGIRKTIEWYLGHQDWVNRVRSGEYRSWIRAHYG